jgi:hypothetical protein
MDRRGVWVPKQARPGDVTFPSGMHTLTEFGSLFRPDETVGHDYSHEAD